MDAKREITQDRRSLRDLADAVEVVWHDTVEDLLDQELRVTSNETVDRGTVYEHSRVYGPPGEHR